MQGQPHDIRVLEELFEGEERGLDSESRSLEEDAFPFHQGQDYKLELRHDAPIDRHEGYCTLPASAYSQVAW